MGKKGHFIGFLVSFGFTFVSLAYNKFAVSAFVYYTNSLYCE